MSIKKEAYVDLRDELKAKEVTLIAVSKTKPVSDILELYEIGQRDFGENYVQELIEKAKQLPPDIRWHFIGHLQSNKVKSILPWVQLIQGVDSLKLLKQINRQALGAGKRVNCLLQVHIAEEETKFGLDEQELEQAIENLKDLDHVCVSGLMGMASFSSDLEKIRGEFTRLKSIYEKHATLQTSNFRLQTLSMGMSADYKVAIEEGSNMVRIGSLLFGERD